MKKLKVEKRNVGPLDIRAEVTSINVEKRTFDITWSTGAKVLRSNWYDGAFYEELSMDPKHVRMGRLTSGTAPFLGDHNGYRVADQPGVIESARLEGGKGFATVRMCAAGIDPEVDKLFGKIADKIVRNVSVGYRTYSVEKTEGIDTKVPTLRAVDWEPYEVSAVSMGADQGAGVRSAPTFHEVTITHRGEIPIHDGKEGQRMDPEELKRQEEAAAKQRALDLKAAQESAALLERERASGIRSAVRAAKLDEGDKFADKLVADGTSLDKARALVIDELAKRDLEVTTVQHTRVTGVEGQDQRDKFVRGVSAWLFEKAGTGMVERAHKMGAKGFEKIELDGGEFRGATLVDIARMCLERAKPGSTRGIYDRKKIVEMAFRASTGDFAVLFENVMHKFMRASYATQENTWRRFCGVDTVSDFRASNRFLNGSFGTLPVVAENAEFQQQEIPDGSKLTVSTETRGAIIGLSRQAMINDDMGALTDLVTRFGASAQRTIESEVYRLLNLNSGLGPDQTDTDPFFHNASRGNVSTGAALTVAAIDADRVHMAAQMDADANDYLDLKPSILLVAPGNLAKAKVINASAYDHTSTDAQKPNAVQGLFSDIVDSPRLAGNRRYLFTAQKDAIKVVFLEGSGEGPVMESQDGFEVDGTQWKARIDVKVNFFDPKHALTNAGQ